MRFGVSKQTLLITAGVIWIIAGVNVLKIGITTWIQTPQDWLFRIGEATLVFLLFFIFIFGKLYYKHTQRIERKTKEKHCPFSFFDIKGWIVMTFMIALGVTIRAFHLLPDKFIAVFYTGLSIALIATGIRFLIFWWKRYISTKNDGKDLPQ